MNVAVRKTAAGAPDVGALKAQAARLRGKVIEMSHAAQAAHLASSLSCAKARSATISAGARLLLSDSLRTSRPWSRVMLPPGTIAGTPPLRDLIPETPGLPESTGSWAPRKQVLIK